MKIEEIKKFREDCLNWKNIKPLHEQLKKSLEINVNTKITLDDWVGIDTNEELSKDEIKTIKDTAKVLIPWKKGPFRVFNLEIDSEWQSNIKYNLLRPHFDLKDKIVADIGCNNGYYMFRMLEDEPKKVIGFDPSAITMLQFDFINHFAKTNVVYERLGVEHLELYNHKFDFIFMLGVLYHRADPIGTLKSLCRGLNKNGEIIIDTFMIDGDEEIALTPNGRYSKIPNIYFIPTIPALKNWLSRAGFIDIEVLVTTTTTKEEQRATSWSFEQSLEDFLDKDDPDRTVEGYPAPKRVYIKAKKRG